MSADANFDFDRPITFNQAARYLPEGSRPSYVTWWRWWRHGIKGVHLRTLVCGGRRYTTRGALENLISTLTAAANDEQPPADAQTAAAGHRGSGEGGQACEDAIRQSQP